MSKYTSVLTRFLSPPSHPLCLSFISFSASFSFFTLHLPIFFSLYSFLRLMSPKSSTYSSQAASRCPLKRTEREATEEIQQQRGGLKKSELRQRVTEARGTMLKQSHVCGGGQERERERKREVFI